MQGEVMDKNDVIVKAVDRLKTSEFQATAVKVELEAHLNRRYHGSGCGDCENGFINCEYCESGDVRCNECDGDWEWDCGYCDGSGRSETSEGVEEDCVDCDGSGRAYCEYCEEGYNACEDCDGGRVECNYCDGNESEDNWGSELVCYEFIMKELAEHGLATYDENRITYIGFNSHWHPVEPLVYLKFYNDGSVDSEITFTMMLTESKNIFLLPKFIEAFKKLADAVGGEFTTTGAGMHMALINDELGRYPSATTDEQVIKYTNYRRSMSLLQPAMFFLGTTTDKSRAMRYRKPAVSNRDKYTSIAYRNGSLEFRVFDTCYHDPEAILDNVVVMSNSMKYWRKKFLSSGVEKICTEVRFGNDKGDELKRLYITSEHLDLLNIGLLRLKPSYYSIREIKQQRKFTTNKTQIKNEVKQVEKDAVIEYKEYESRFAWTVEARKHDYVYKQTHPDYTAHTEPPSPVLMKEILSKAEEVAKEVEQTKEQKEMYVQRKIQQWLRRPAGDYILN